LLTINDNGRNIKVLLKTRNNSSQLILYSQDEEIYKILFNKSGCFVNVSKHRGRLQKAIKTIICQMLKKASHFGIQMHMKKRLID
jgi:hypothetical protein